MREIKFRTWVERDKRMSSPIDLVDIANGKMDHVAWRVSVTTREVVEGDAIMEFTGILDKNGKEIYEGDIIEATDNWAEDECPRYVVQWVEDDTRLGFELVHPETEDYEASIADDYGFYPLEVKRAGFTVIGNLYENPELLKP